MIKEESGGVIRKRDIKAGVKQEKPMDGDGGGGPAVKEEVGQ